VIADDLVVVAKKLNDGGKSREKYPHQRYYLRRGPTNGRMGKYSQRRKAASRSIGEMRPDKKESKGREKKR